MQPTRKPIAAALLALGVLVGGPAVSQTAAPAAPTAAATLTPSHVAAARDVIVASGAIRSFDAVLPSVSQQLRSTFTRQRPELQKDIDDSLKAIEPQVEGQRDEMITLAARIYASRLSETELKDIAAFFNSPTGQKFVQSQPDIFDDLFREMQNWMGRVSDQALAMFRDEMKKRGHEL